MRTQNRTGTLYERAKRKRLEELAKQIQAYDEWGVRPAFGPSDPKDVREAGRLLRREGYRI